jgi:glycosyltransferase involved in cell wall biosynthesis
VRQASPIVLFTNSTIMGGMEEHVLQLGAGLVQRGLRVGVICSTRPAIEPLRDALRDAGVEVHALAERGGSPVGVWQRFGSLVRILRDYQGCVLHVHSTGYRGADLVVLAGRVAGVQASIRTMHLPPVPPIPLTDRILTPVRDRLLARIICVAEQNRTEHIHQLGRDPKRCSVVHNGIDFQRFAAVDRSTKPSSPVVGTVSRLAEFRKGISYFLAMAALVAKVRPDVRFLVVGDGELLPDLQEQARKFGIADAVVFTGERRDVPSLLATMRVFVNPSLWEAGPYTVLEAAAMRVPIVSTPVGFVPEIIRSDGCEGRLVPPADPVALARAVLETLSDDSGAQRMADRAYARIAVEFSMDRMVDRLAELYDEVSPYEDASPSSRCRRAPGTTAARSAGVPQASAPSTEPASRRNSVRPVDPGFAKRRSVVPARRDGSDRAIDRPTLC